MTRLELLRRRLGLVARHAVRAEAAEVPSFFSQGKGGASASAVRTEEGICIHE